MIVEHYHVAVIGGGPAGVAVIGELLFQGVSNIVWFDPEPESAGRLDNYHQVPSNTKVGLFTKYGRKVGRVLEDPDTHVAALTKLDPLKNCPLKYAADMVRSVKQGLRDKCKRLINQSVLNVEKCSLDQDFVVKTANSEARAKIVILATGCHPKSPPFDNGKSIDLDVALDPAKLGEEIQKRKVTHVFVYGNSHSGVLVMKNLDALQVPFKCIHKRDPLYALYMNDCEQIIYDNTGLKGVAAEWCQANWERIDKLSDLSTRIPDDAHVISAIGFERNGGVAISSGNITFWIEDLTRVDSGRLAYENTIIDGLYGVGIAFPGKDVYSYNGETIEEYSVGLWKFCRHIEKDVVDILAYLRRPHPNPSI